jgi:hypothetical protein
VLLGGATRVRDEQKPWWCRAVTSTRQLTPTPPTARLQRSRAQSPTRPPTRASRLAQTKLSAGRGRGKATAPLRRGARILDASRNGPAPGERGSPRRPVASERPRAHGGRGRRAKGSATCQDADKNGVSTRARGRTRASAAPAAPSRPCSPIALHSGIWGVPGFHLPATPFWNLGSRDGGAGGLPRLQCMSFRLGALGGFTHVDVVRRVYTTDPKAIGSCSRVG